MWVLVWFFVCLDLVCGLVFWLVFIFHCFSVFVAVLIQVFAADLMCLVTSRLVFVQRECCGLSVLGFFFVFVGFGFCRLAGEAVHCPHFWTDLWQLCFLVA